MSGTSHRKTTAYHPQTNGLTSQFNKTIGDMISMYVYAEDPKWDAVLPYITFRYYTALRETTHFTAFHLEHGREVVTMLYAMLLPEDAGAAIAGADEFVRHVETAREIARDRARHQQENDAFRYNVRLRAVRYQPGDHVSV